MVCVWHRIDCQNMTWTKFLHVDGNVDARVSLEAALKL